VESQIGPGLPLVKVNACIEFPKQGKDCTDVESKYTLKFGPPTISKRTYAGVPGLPQLNIGGFLPLKGPIKIFPEES